MNIILISLDTTRADRLSCYGHFRRTSPHIDRVSEEGAIFKECFSPHIPTFPGHTTMMTGRDLYAHQITGQSGTPELSNEIPMLAEILTANGYYTAAADNLGRWFARGFQHIEPYGWDTTNSLEWRKGEAVNKAALKVLNMAAAQDKPFFLFLHYWDPHTPYLPPAPFSRMFYEGDEFDPNNHSMDELWEFENFKWYFREWMPGVTDIEFPKAQYDAEVAYMDTCLSHLFTRLDELALTGETMLVLTADHGEELDEHAHWFDHHGLYDTNLHIPLIMRYPREIPEGTRINGMVRTQDITPTILDYADLLDPVLKLDGTSLRFLIDSPGSISRGSTDVVYCTENTWMKKRAVRTHHWKLILPLEIPDIHGNSEVELYDLTRDPGELNNVARELPEVVQRLTRLNDEWVGKRLAETGNADPLPLQPLPLKRVGKMEAAVPHDKKLMKELDEEPLVKLPADEKLKEGDFVGYEREEE